MVLSSRFVLRSVLLLSLLPPLLVTGCGKKNKHRKDSGKGSIDFTDPGSMDEKTKAAIDKIKQLGYVAGAQPVPDTVGVTIYEPDLVYPGLNLYVSAHRAEATLMDMKGNTLHRWARDLTESFPDVQHNKLPTPFSAAWGRVRLMPNGDLFAIHEAVGLIKLDRESNLIWAVKNMANHDLDFDADGNIYVLTYQKEQLPRFGSEEVMLDYVRKLGPNGDLLDSISIDQAFADSEYGPSDRLIGGNREIYHTNMLRFLDGTLADRMPAFKKGNLLISCRDTDTIAVLDPMAKKIVWKATADWKGQHSPSLLENGHILLFDNLGGSEERGKSRIIEFDPLTVQTVWMYEGTPENKFYSMFSGACWRMPNGNTLITESVAGKVIEVTKDKRIVWEFVNPDTIGNMGDIIAVIPELNRIEPDQVSSWLDVKGAVGAFPPAAGDEPTTSTP